MDFGAINWFAVLVCVLVSMLSGAVWYNPKTFFPTWWKAIGKSDQDAPGTGNMAVTWTLTVLSSFVQAAAVAFILNALGVSSLMAGAGIGALLWLGLIAPTNLVNKLFAGHGLKVWAIEAGNHLLNFVLFGAILGAWR